MLVAETPDFKLDDKRFPAVLVATKLCEQKNMFFPEPQTKWPKSNQTTSTATVKELKSELKEMSSFDIQKHNVINISMLFRHINLFWQLG